MLAAASIAIIRAFAGQSQARAPGAGGEHSGTLPHGVYDTGDAGLRLSGGNDDFPTVSDAHGSRDVRSDVHERRRTGFHTLGFGQLPTAANWGAPLARYFT